MRVPWSIAKGAYVPVTLFGPRGRMTLQGLVDTGAHNLLLDSGRLALLGLEPVDTVRVVTASGAAQKKIYRVGAEIAGRHLGLLKAVSLDVPGEAECVLGRSFLATFHLHFDSASGTLELL